VRAIRVRSISLFQNSLKLRRAIPIDLSFFTLRAIGSRYEVPMTGSMGVPPTMHSQTELNPGRITAASAIAKSAGINGSFLTIWKILGMSPYCLNSGPATKISRTEGSLSKIDLPSECALLQNPAASSAPKCSPPPPIENTQRRIPRVH
jgi:hypothetical protein